MSVTIEIPKALQTYTKGAVIIKVDHCQSVCDCINALIKQFPALDGQILDNEEMLLLRWSIYINNQILSERGGLSSSVKTDDVITLLPMISGG